MKVKLVGAKKGHSLLKKKADALTMRLRALLKSILQAKEDMGAAFRDGNFALAEVKYAAGDIKPTVLESVGTAQKRVEIRIDNIAGVKVPVFKAIEVSSVGDDHTGLSKGGQQITKARQTFSKSVDVLVQLATLQTSFQILDEAIKVRACPGGTRPKERELRQSADTAGAREGGCSPAPSRPTRWRCARESCRDDEPTLADRR